MFEWNAERNFTLRVSLLGSVSKPLTPNGHYSGGTAPLTFKRRILYIYSTNIGTEYFKHDIYSPFFTAPLTFKRFILYIYSTNIGTEYFKHGVYTLRFFIFKMQFFS